MLEKFNARVERLVQKMEVSQTPVPGFILGLSGTDSIVAFLMAYCACEQLGMPQRVMGVHYVDALRRKTWFEEHIVPWLAQQCPEAEIHVETPPGGNHDQFRWADIHYRALNEFDGKSACPREPGMNYWVAGTINATEKALGKYSLLADSASIQLVQTLYKSTILSICEELGVPKIAMDMARVPDCLCGREELAAENIELIDDILTYRVDPTKHAPELLTQLYAYVRGAEADNGFKKRVPYVI